ncbi:hypothetical protein TELCIR_16404, partial [Teladorsagia circumcincta]
DVWNEHRVPFAQNEGKISCCEYEDPSRLKERKEQFIVLEFRYAQNVKYFEEMLPEIRQLLEFSENVQHEGDEGLSDYLIFGDDVDFMRRMVESLGKTKREQVRALFSTNSEGIDLYVASRACGAMLITAPTSTFGWWLAFFTPNQNSVFYSNDKRRMADKVPQKSLFL